MKVVALLVLAVAAWAWVPMEADLNAHISGRGAPEGWRLVGAPEPTRLHQVVFSFKHDEVKRNKLENIFWEVSNPKHANYGKYLTFDEVKGFFAAPESDISYVQDWLSTNGASDIVVNNYRDMITAKLPIETLESLLNTKFALFERLRDNVEFTRIVQPYYLPEVLASMLAIVGNLIDFPGFYPPTRVSGHDLGAWPNSCGTPCAGQITPAVIMQQYNITKPTTVAANSSVAVAEFQAQHYDQPDLDSFTSACSLSNLVVTDKNGGNVASLCSAGACIECLLDLEYLGALVQPIKSLSDYWYQSYSLLDWINGVLADKNPALMHSVSYGNDEIQQTSTQYMYQCNDQFMAAGARGISIMFASGDQGVWGRSGHNGHFNPDFPAASPYITAVGGSDLETANIGPETCCADSGGGFSVTFARPSYQDSAVLGYFNSGVQLPTASNYNASGRGYPDVSAIFGLKVPYCIASSGRFEGVAGTSASSPVATSMFALMNNIQFNAGKPALGFLNPWIYQTLAAHPDAFYDVTTGENNGGSGQGFYAYKGWDPCTGAGTINFKAIINYLP